MADDFMDGLDQGFAEGWRSEQGDTIQGIVIGVSRRDHKFTKDASGAPIKYPIITVRRITNDVLTAELIAIHCNDTGRRLWCDEETPVKGDRVAFRDDGVKLNKVGTEYHAFAKTIQRGNEVPAHLRLSIAAPTPAPAPAAAAPADNKFEPF